MNLQHKFGNNVREMASPTKKRTRAVRILPSILAADMAHLQEACRMAEEAGADGIHIDIMDGSFVNNLSMGIATIGAIRKHTRLPLSVHLMVEHPSFFINRCCKEGADTILFHVECRDDPHETLRLIHDNGKASAITLNPETPLDAAMPYLEEIDQVLCMTVHPGFGGQRFIDAVIPKIEKLHDISPEIDIAVDGGLDRFTAQVSAAAGANIFFIGSALFKSNNMREELLAIRTNVEKSPPSSSPTDRQQKPS